ncbi:hypothetical protein ACFFX1_54655 [Dactylosporangium sucinum]|uniref:Uncharacterized protein n=1 Tax=Dactylosporangium sucinum TaxID=1424081 RepID=A0A917U300_9ACTN|nr:hypothetical protein [Dactylosporangium sucinum]GGM53798.1 hypothetical protein GCM10007977_064270 [Dactylosporangium sucinum]
MTRDRTLLEQSRHGKATAGVASVAVFVLCVIVQDLLQVGVYINATLSAAVAGLAYIVVRAVADPLFFDHGDEGEADEHWADDGSGEREGWSAHHIRQLSPHSAWAHGAILDGAPVQAVADPEPAGAPQPAPAYAPVVYDLDWLVDRLRPGRHRKPEAGAR